MVDQVTRRVAGHFVSWLATEAPQEGNGRPREPRAAATCNKILSRLHGLWEHLEKRGIVEANPFSKQLLKAPKSEKRALTPDELKSVFAEIKPGDVRDALVCLLLTGMRRNELMSLRMGDLVVKDGVTCLYVRKERLLDASVV